MRGGGAWLRKSLPARGVGAGAGEQGLASGGLGLASGELEKPKGRVGR